MTEAEVAAALDLAFRADVEVEKPGNVSHASPGHGMSALDFLRSAEAAIPELLDRTRAVGERILRAVAATRRAVGCNTNLGLVLLAGPLAEAALQDGPGTLRARLGATLTAMEPDAPAIYAAIRLANPGGLGSSGRHDVHDLPPSRLSLAMREAAARDRIAAQYVTVYDDIWRIGLPRLPARASVGFDAPSVQRCFLAFLAHVEDSHVARREGWPRAVRLRRAARAVAEQVEACENPADFAQVLREFDRALKHGGCNPGTTADLTVASVLASRLEGA